MNSSPSSPSDSCRKVRRGSAKGLIIGCVLVVGAVIAWKLPFTRALLSDYLPEEEEADNSKYVLHTAEMSPFRITITENGTVDSLQNSTVVNSVEGTTTIISLVPEGSQVNGPLVAEAEGVIEYVDAESEAERKFILREEDGTEHELSITMGPFTEVLIEDRGKVRKGDYIAGDMLCELDSSSLVQAEKEQQIGVTTARANVEKGAKGLEIQQTTNESALAQARLTEKLAQLDLEKYTADGGEYEQMQQTLEGEIKQYEETLAMSKEDFERVQDQARRGYTSLNNLEAARIKVTQQKILLDVKRSELALLEDFTKIRTESELRQTAEDSKRETRRVELEGQAAMAGLRAEYDALKLTLQLEEEKLERLIRQIKACRLIAPQQGEVVYASQQSRRSEPVVIEEGATVRERQAIINLPDLEQMKVDARIHESRISRVAVGQPVEISVDAVTSVTYHGILETISSVPVPGNWPNTDLKEYEAEIRITDDADLVRKLKPGMTAEIRIIVDDRDEDVLQVPVQSVVSLADNFYTYVLERKNGPVRRELTVGDANDEYMEILKGLEPGERVIMSPRTHFSRELNELELKLLNEKEQGAADRKRAQAPGRPMNLPTAPAVSAKPGPPVAELPAGGRPAGGPGSGPPDPAKMFERMDKNSDGEITKDESDFRGKFDEYDADKDGKVTQQELTKAFSK